jgi:hypothetical protein
MGRFVNLTGVNGGVLEGSFEHHFSTITGAKRILKTERICATAGDAGAVTIWIDDAGAYRCRFSRHGATENEECFGAKFKAFDWLKEWRPRCYSNLAVN